TGRRRRRRRADADRRAPDDTAVAQERRARPAPLPDHLRPDGVELRQGGPAATGVPGLGGRRAPGRPRAARARSRTAAGPLAPPSAVEPSGPWHAWRGGPSG